MYNKDELTTGIELIGKSVFFNVNIFANDFMFLISIVVLLVLKIYLFQNLDNFAAQFGGLVGLCSGFSLISVLEFMYWFSLRIWHDQRKQKKAEEAAKDIEISTKSKDD